MTDQELVAEFERVSEQEASAREAAWELSRRRREIVTELAGRNTLRDTAELLGLSYQRIFQLLRRNNGT